VTPKRDTIAGEAAVAPGAEARLGAAAHGADPTIRAEAPADMEAVEAQAAAATRIKVAVARVRAVVAHVKVAAARAGARVVGARHPATCARTAIAMNGTTMPTAITASGTTLATTVIEARAPMNPRT